MPTVDALRAKIVAAAGTPPSSSYEQISYTQYGATATRTIVRSGEDVRETSTLGQLQKARGTYQKQDWSQNVNGQTVLAQSSSPDATEDDFKTTVTHVAVPFDAYVIARLDAAGYGTKEYVDPITYRIVRRDKIVSQETSVISYDDFRTRNGYTTAWHWTARDGHADNDIDYRVDALVQRPVSTAEIAIPPPRRALVVFPPGEVSVTLPVRLIEGRFVVRVTIGGHGLDFLLDTGASGIAIEDNAARRLGLQQIVPFSQEGNSKPLRRPWVTVPDMSVGALQMHDVVTSTLSGATDEVDGVKIVGVLGFDFIAELLLELDYEHGSVTAMHGDLTVASLASGSVLLGVRLGDEVPLASISINGYSGDEFVIDTGCTAALVISDHFARHFPHALVDLSSGIRAGDRDEQLSIHPNEGAPHYTVVGGVANGSDARRYVLAKVTMGTVEFTNVAAYLEVPRKPTGPSYDGLIGQDKLRYFTVWLDYARSTRALAGEAFYAGWPRSTARSTC